MQQKCQSIYFTYLFISSCVYVFSVLIPAFGIWCFITHTNNLLNDLFLFLLIIVSASVVSLLLASVYLLLLIKMDPDVWLRDVARALRAYPKGVSSEFTGTAVSLDWDASRESGDSSLGSLVEVYRVTRFAPFVNIIFWFVSISSFVYLSVLQEISGSGVAVQVTLVLSGVFIVSSVSFMYSSGFAFLGFSTMYADPSEVLLHTLWRKKKFQPGAGIAIFRQTGFRGGWCRVLLVSESGSAARLRIRMADAVHLAALWKYS